MIHFISFLINTYISPAYRDDSPKALSLLASRLHTRLQLCRENYRTLTSNKFSQHSHSSQGFQSLSGAMVLSLYGIITPSSAQKHNPLNPFPSGHLQFRNFLIIRLLLNYGIRTGELLLLECGFAPIFPDTCYHLTHYWPAAADIPVASDNPVH
ncbi:hypothetical protein ACRW2I_22975, partial [Escherichia coli]